MDLFSGIGGFSLAASWTGEIETVQFVEIDPFCQKVLQKNFKGVPIHDDIKTFTYTTSIRCNGLPIGGQKETETERRLCEPKRDIQPRIDILTAGVPCQPASVAGNRKGKSDDRWLWPETFRVIGEVKPTWCILENVPGLLTLDNGLAFEDCCLTLEDEGYEVQSFIIPACAVNAPHRRNRVWIIAHAISYGDVHGGNGGKVCDLNRNDKEKKQEWDNKQPWIKSSDCHAPDTNETVLQERKVLGRSFQQENQTAVRNLWEEDWLEVATRFCRVDDGLPRRMDRLKALGNSIVPQIMYQIFLAILEVERSTQ